MADDGAAGLQLSGGALAVLPVAWFGKLPAFGDFVARGGSAEFRGKLDDWLAAGIREMGEREPADWRERFLGAPAWAFVLPADAPDAPARIGAVVPSHDRVGRPYPLCGWCELEGSAMRHAVPDGSCGAIAVHVLSLVLELAGTQDPQQAEALLSTSLDLDRAALSPDSARHRREDEAVELRPDGPSVDAAIVACAVSAWIEDGTRALWWTASEQGSSAAVQVRLPLGPDTWRRLFARGAVGGGVG